MERNKIDSHMENNQIASAQKQFRDIHFLALSAPIVGTIETIKLLKTGSSL